jgi:hypothetical protein
MLTILTEINIGSAYALGAYIASLTTLVLVLVSLLDIWRHR